MLGKYRVYLNDGITLINKHSTFVTPTFRKKEMTFAKGEVLK